MTYSACDGSFMPESVAAVVDLIAWHHRAYPPPDYETRCYLLAQKRAAECKTAEQRRITERNTDPSLQALAERHHE